MEAPERRLQAVHDIATATDLLATHLLVLPSGDLLQALALHRDVAQIQHGLLRLPVQRTLDRGRQQAACIQAFTRGVGRA